MAHDGGFWGGLVLAGIIGLVAYYNVSSKLEETEARLKDTEAATKNACFELIPDKMNTAYLLDKCTGQTKMLVKVTVERDEKSQLKDSFSYLWYELSDGSGPPIMVYGIADERNKR
ncbi:MAG TPA: hypothetical protein PLW48_11150 [Alphaproteobacteria bacterium]|nr:hypothetical protein [Alphaproteobacteria bacterium]